MTALPLAAVPFIMKFLGLIWVIVALLLILMVLIQKGRGGGLTAAFGGGAGGGLLGTKTGDFLTWVTISLVVVWLLLSVVAAKWFVPRQEGIIPRTPGGTVPAVKAEVEKQLEIPVLQDANETN